MKPLPARTAPSPDTLAEFPLTNVGSIHQMPPPEKCVIEIHPAGENHVALYYCGAEGRRWGIRTICTTDPIHFREVLEAWTAKGKISDFRA